MNPENESVLDAEKKVVDEGTQEESSKISPEEFHKKIMDEIDARLAERDKAILKGMQDIVASVKQSPKQVEEKKSDDVEVTQQDFYNDPVGAMQKFFLAKVAPALEKSKEVQPDPAFLQNQKEVALLKLKDEVGNEMYERYRPFLDRVIEKVDPRILSMPDSRDAIWRLTRSYADDYMADQEKRRHDINQKAALEKSGGIAKTGSEKIELAADEKEIAEKFGIAPELYRKYGSIEEVEIGSAHKKEVKK